MEPMTCNKNWVFRGGEHFPPCLRNATVRVSLSRAEVSHEVYTCDTCASMLVLRCPAWNPTVSRLEGARS